MLNSHKTFEDLPETDFVLLADSGKGIDFLYILKWTNRLPRAVYFCDEPDKEMADDLSQEFGIPIQMSEVRSQKSEETESLVLRDDIFDISDISDIPDITDPQYADFINERKSHFKSLKAFKNISNEPFALFCSEKHFVENFRLLNENFCQTPELLIIPDNESKESIPIKCMHLSEFIKSKLKINILYGWGLGSHEYTRYLIKLGSTENTMFLGESVIEIIEENNTILYHLNSTIFYYFGADCKDPKFKYVFIERINQFVTFARLGRLTFNGLFEFSLHSDNHFDNKYDITLNIAGGCHSSPISKFLSDKYNIEHTDLTALTAYQSFHNIIFEQTVCFEKLPPFDYRVFIIGINGYYALIENNINDVINIFDKYISLCENTVFYVMPDLFDKNYPTSLERNSTDKDFAEMKQLNVNFRQLLQSRYKCVFSGSRFVENRTDNVFVDSRHFLDQTVYKQIADDISNIIEMLVGNRNLQNNANNQLKFKRNYLNDLNKTLSESLVGIDDYCREIQSYHKSGQTVCFEKNGAIVMNCNPFTLGHKYLISESAKKVDTLYIFVVEEDKSFFPFADRFDMVVKGTADIPNVCVLPSGKFIISSLTFKEYFYKSEILHDEMPNTLMDVITFAVKIAPALGISIRFAGEEPLDRVTAEYNRTMSQVLPFYGIEFEEIPRKITNGAVISASRVRELLKNGDFENIAELVPESTMNYLRSNRAVNMK
ncbi:MAG: adenylyltransferase/cytidyltransferase family protein [Ruminococcus sp.]|jgi:cytidyltransferase-like protein|nr:adenylyltransferase/cytidyltransferase family protein [Ruminococcus sp.]